MNPFECKLSRRRFLQVSAAAGVASTVIPALSLPEAPARKTAAPSAYQPGPTIVTKSVCHQCPARCGIDVHTTDGRVHAIYGSLEHPLSNGKLCPKGHLGTYVLYDPDRFKGPMRRSNPRKGRREDPGFVPITWDEALATVATRLQGLRDRGEAHRFALLYGRGWGKTDSDLLKTFAKLYGTPNVINHSSLCADASKKAKKAMDGNDSYNAYDYRNSNYLLIFGASFLEAFRPYNYLMQVWGHIRTKSPRTQVTVVDVHLNTTAAAADRALLVKPGTDGALALAIAHVLLTEGLWDRDFVGDFNDGVNRFRAGETIAPESFQEKWVHGLASWWNAELKDRSPAWAASVTTLREKDILAVAREFGHTRPAIALFERGATSYSNGAYNGMAIHALNALVGSLYAEGGLMYQMPVPYGPLPVKEDDYLDDYARADTTKHVPRIDRAKTDAWPMVSNMMQDVAKNHRAGAPYTLDTALFYLTNPIWSAPDNGVWEEALKNVFVIETSPFPSETAWYADLVLPDHSYLERLQDAPTYPFLGWPMTSLRVPAIKPLHNTRAFSEVLIGIGKRLHGPMGAYFNALDNTENMLRHMAAGFAAAPGDNGVDDFDSWVEKGVWYRKPYLWQQRRGDFFEWDGQGYRRLMSAAEVKDKLLKTPSGKFEFKSAWLEAHADYLQAKLNIAPERVGYPQWLPPRYTGGDGDLHLITPKLALHAEGRGANLPHAIDLLQPTVGGRDTVYLEIHPDTARQRGIRDGDRVRIRSALGSIEAYARHYAGTRPDTVVLPLEHGHWAGGRWTKSRLPGNSSEITANVSEAISGLANYYSGKVRVERADSRRMPS